MLCRATVYCILYKTGLWVIVVFCLSVDLQHSIYSYCVYTCQKLWLPFSLKWGIHIYVTFAYPGKQMFFFEPHWSILIIQEQEAATQQQTSLILSWFSLVLSTNHHQVCLMRYSLVLWTWQWCVEVLRLTYSSCFKAPLASSWEELLSEEEDTGRRVIHAIDCPFSRAHRWLFSDDRGQGKVKLHPCLWSMPANLNGLWIRAVCGISIYSQSR